MATASPANTICCVLLTLNASVLSVLKTIVPSVPVSVIAIEVSPSWKAPTLITLAVRIPTTPRSPCIIVLLEPDGSIVIFPEEDEMVFPPITILPTVRAVGDKVEVTDPSVTSSSPVILIF